MRFLVQKQGLVINSLPGVAAEVEPNDVFGQATPLGVVLPGTSSATIAAAINPAGNEDWFSFELTQTASVRISSFSSATDRGVCTADNVLTFHTANGIEAALSDDANGSCGVLDGISGTEPDDLVLSSLPPGTYFVHLRAYSSTNVIGAYFILVEAR